MTSRLGLDSPWLFGSLANSLAREEYDNDGSQVWVQAACTGRLRYIKLLSRARSTRILIAASDGRNLVHAQVTKKALDSFESGIGKSFLACNAGEMLKVDDCQFKLSPSADEEERLILYINAFGLVQGYESSFHGAMTRLEEEPEIKRLWSKVFDPADVVSVPDDEQNNDKASIPIPSDNFMSQVPHARDYRQNYRTNRRDQDISVDGSINLAPPIQMASKNQLETQYDRTSRNNSRSGQSTEAQRQKLLAIVAPPKIKPASGGTANVQTRDNDSEKVTSALNLQSKRLSVSIEARQRKILGNPASWHYPLPDVEGNSKLLPPELLSEFQRKFHNGHLKKHMSKKPEAAEARIRRRSAGEVSDRSDEPVAWSPSPTADAAPVRHLPAEDVHDDAFRPPDSSGSMPGTNGHETGVQSQVHRDVLDDDDTSDNTSASDSGLDESVPYVVGEHRSKMVRPADTPCERPTLTQEKTSSPRQNSTSEALVPSTDLRRANEAAASGAQETGWQGNQTAKRAQNGNLELHTEDTVMEDPSIAYRQQRREFLQVQARNRALTSASDHHISRPGSQNDRNLNKNIKLKEDDTDTGVPGKDVRRPENIHEFPNKRRRIDQGAADADAVSSNASGGADTRRSSRQSSPRSFDPFVAFIKAYDDYEGGRRHFVTMCREIEKCGKSLHRSLWDDYVVRNFTNYDESCGVSYRDFYDEHVDAPSYTEGVLNPASLKRILDIAKQKASSRESLSSHTPSSGGTRPVPSNVHNEADQPMVIDDDDDDTTAEKNQQPSSHSRLSDGLKSHTSLSKSSGPSNVLMIDQLPFTHTSGELLTSSAPPGNQSANRRRRELAARLAVSETKTASSPVSLKSQVLQSSFNQSISPPSRKTPRLRGKVQDPATWTPSNPSIKKSNAASTSQGVNLAYSSPIPAPSSSSDVNLGTASAEAHSSNETTNLSNGVTSNQSMANQDDDVQMLDPDSVRKGDEYDDSPSVSSQTGRLKTTDSRHSRAGSSTHPKILERTPKQKRKEQRIQQMSREADKLHSIYSQSTSSPRLTPSRNAFAFLKSRRSKHIKPSESRSSVANSTSGHTPLPQESADSSQERETVFQEFARAYRGLKIHGGVLSGDVPEVDVLEWDLG